VFTARYGLGLSIKRSALRLKGLNNHKHRSLIDGTFLYFTMESTNQTARCQENAENLERATRRIVVSCAEGI
jgi:hypothetical protein